MAGNPLNPYTETLAGVSESKAKASEGLRVVAVMRLHVAIGKRMERLPV